MRQKVIIALAGLAALTASAVTLDVPQLPAPAYLNWEVAADTALPANRTNGLRVFRLELTFDATPSNNVQVAFGRDTLPEDGFLKLEETDCINRMGLRRVVPASARHEGVPHVRARQHVRTAHAQGFGPCERAGGAPVRRVL